MRKEILICAISLGLAAGAALAQQKADPRLEGDPIRDHCEALVKQFDAQDVSHVEAAKLAEAKKDAERGTGLCQTNAEWGVKNMEHALRDIGVTPK